MYNEEKTKCMFINPSVMKDLYVPMFHLGYLNIKAVEKETYLGYLINTNMSDDDYIIKETRNINLCKGKYACIRNFKHCTVNVKITFFKTYCSSFYCCPVWIEFCTSAIGKVCVAFNKVFQTFLNVPSYLLHSWLFLICDVMNVPPIRRKFILKIEIYIFL